MKKLLTIISLAAVTVYSQAQGYVGSFGSNTRGVWDDYTSTPRLAADISIAFLYGTGTPLVSTLQSAVATNTTSVAWTAASAWNDILNDSNFKLATNNGVGLASLTINANGSSSYLGGATFAVAGSAIQAYQVYYIGWNSAYATPQAAAAAGSAVGWSSPFSYSFVSSIGSPVQMSTVLTPFGVVAGAVPEPGTLALAAMGGASLLLFRRRK